MTNDQEDGGDERHGTNSDIEQTIAELQDEIELLEREGEPVFDTPWQARAFSIVVALYQDGAFSWEVFQSRLIDEIQKEGVLKEQSETDRHDGNETIYYRNWMTAFVKWLVENEILTEEELEEREMEFATGERDASEFVVGNHSHDH